MARLFQSLTKSGKRKLAAEEALSSGKARGSDSNHADVSGKAMTLHEPSEPAQAGVGSATVKAAESTSLGIANSEPELALTEADYGGSNISLADVEQRQGDQFGKENATMTNNGTVDMTLTPEAVAYRLLVDIMEAEGRSLTDLSVVRSGRMNRNTLLDAYSECLDAVRGTRQSAKK